MQQVNDPADHEGHADQNAEPDGIITKGNHSGERILVWPAT